MFLITKYFFTHAPVQQAVMGTARTHYILCFDMLHPIVTINELQKNILMHDLSNQGNPTIHLRISALRKVF